MSVWNIRGVPEALARRVKSTAAARGVTLAGLVIDTMEREVGSEKNTARENKGGNNEARGDGNKVRVNQGDCAGVGSDGGEDESHGGTIESKNGGSGSVGKKLVPRKKIADVSAGAVEQSVGATPPCPDMGKAQIDGGIGDEIDYLDQERYLDQKAAGRRSEVAPKRGPVVFKARSQGITDLCVGMGDTCLIPEKNSGVDMQALRDICAGKIPVSAEEAMADALDYNWGPIEVDLCGEKFYNEVDGENYICGLEKHGPKIHHGEWIKV